MGKIDIAAWPQMEDNIMYKTTATVYNAEIQEIIYHWRLHTDEKEGTIEIIRCYELTLTHAE